MKNLRYAWQYSRTTILSINYNQQLLAYVYETVSYCTIKIWLSRSSSKQMLDWYNNFLYVKLRDTFISKWMKNRIDSHSIRFTIFLNMEIQKKNVKNFQKKITPIKMLMKFCIWHSRLFINSLLKIQWFAKDWPILWKFSKFSNFKIFLERLWQNFTPKIDTFAMCLKLGTVL